MTKPPRCPWYYSYLEDSGTPCLFRLFLWLRLHCHVCWIVAVFPRLPLSKIKKGNTMIMHFHIPNSRPGLTSAAHILKLEHTTEEITLALEQGWRANLWSIPYNKQTNKQLHSQSLSFKQYVLLATYSLGNLGHVISFACSFTNPRSANTDWARSMC